MLTMIRIPSDNRSCSLPNKGFCCGEIKSDQNQKWCKEDVVTRGASVSPNLLSCYDYNIGI